MDNRSYIRSLMVLHKISVKELANKMTEITGKKYTRDSINGKLIRDTLTLKECQIIAEILGYNIKFEKTNIQQTDEHVKGNWCDNTTIED